MSDDKKREEKRTITVDVDTLNELIDAKVAAKVAEASVKGPDEDEFAKAMRAIRGQDRPAPEVRYEDCESPITGARFRAKIMPSRSSPLGRVIDLEDYTWPDGASIPQSAGGLMPDEYVPALEAPEAQGSSAIKVKYDHWRYWDFQRVDITEFASGKLFSKYILRSEAERRRSMDAAAAKVTADVGA